MESNTKEKQEPRRKASAITVEQMQEDRLTQVD